MVAEEDRGALGSLEEKIGNLLAGYQELKKEREELATSLAVEREKVTRLERRLELLSQDKEKVKTRIDQLLLQLKGIDI
jgi:chromosome segregation ATPase